MTGSTNISFEVPRPLTEWEMDDIRMCIENVMDKTSFFYAGSDDVSDDVVRFLGEREILTNLEVIQED